MSAPGFYNELENVEYYISIAGESVCGGYLTGILADYLPAGSSLLELGCGPGLDAKRLSQQYRVTASDASEIFLEHCRQTLPGISLARLDAVTLETDAVFDCIYSNKVLMHLTASQLERSLSGQARILKPGGLIMHTFWRGSGEEISEGLLFRYYRESEMVGILSGKFEIIEINRYTESDEDDSFYFVARCI